MMVKVFISFVFNNFIIVFFVVWCVGGVDCSGGVGVICDVIILVDLNIYVCVFII